MKYTIWIGLVAGVFLLLGGAGPAGAQRPAEFAAAPPGALTDCAVMFSDLPADHRAYPYVHCLACRNIMGGYADGTFRPDASVTRGEIAHVIALAAGYTDAIPANRQTFVDVPATDPNWLYIEQAYTHGLLTGYECGVAPGGPCPGRYFHPEHHVTRAQTAKLVTLAAGYTDAIAPAHQTFNEVPPSHPYWLYVERAVAHGIISGYQCDGTTYNVCGATVERCPGLYYRCCFDVTRAQLAKFVANAFFPTCATSNE